MLANLQDQEQSNLQEKELKPQDGCGPTAQSKGAEVFFSQLFPGLQAHVHSTLQMSGGPSGRKIRGCYHRIAPHSAGNPQVTTECKAQPRQGDISCRLTLGPAVHCPQEQGQMHSLLHKVSNAATLVGKSVTSRVFLGGGSVFKVLLGRVV